MNCDLQRFTSSHIPTGLGAQSRVLMLPFFEFPFLTALEKCKFNNSGCSRELVLERDYFLKSQGEVYTLFKAAVQLHRGSKQWGECSTYRRATWALEEMECLGSKLTADPKDLLLVLEDEGERDGIYLDHRGDQDSPAEDEEAPGARRHLQSVMGLWVFIAINRH